MTYEFEGEVWRYPGEAAWHFVTLPADIAAGIRMFGHGAPGFGSVRIRAATGRSTWRTSLFPDRGSASYLLPLKADVRRKENLAAGARARFTVEIEL